MGGATWRYPTPVAPIPVGKQRRAAETIRAAVDATVDLLEQLPVHYVTLQRIRERSGVSQGSLTHHFGGRDGLIAAAHVARYERSCVADAAFLARYEGVLSTAGPFAATMVGHIGEMLSDERRTVRWIRMSAIGAAFGDDDLASTLSAAYTSLADRLTRYADEARRSGLTQPDAHPRTIALLLSMHAQGLVLDDLLGVDVPESAWHRVMTRFVTSFLMPEAVRELEAQAEARFGGMWRAEVFGPPGRVPSEVAERLGALRDTPHGARHGAPSDDAAGSGSDPSGPAELLATKRLLESAERSGRTGPLRPWTDDGTAEQILSTGSTVLRERGAAAVDVHALREEAGLSAVAFQRIFGSREDYVRVLRVRLEIARAANSTSRFAALVAGSRSPQDMRKALEADAIRMSEDVSRTAMWQRIETLAAARTDSELRDSLAKVQRAARDLLIEQVCLAQGRGLIDPELPARGVARLLDSSVFWHVFHGLDAKRPDRDQWIGTLRRIAALISPEPAQHPSVSD